MRRRELEPGRSFPWLSAVAFVALCAVAWQLRPEELGRWALYGIVSFAYLTVKLLASFSHYTAPGPPVKKMSIVVGAVVPAHNEDAEVLRRCVEVLAPQVDRIVVIDDGSRDLQSRSLILDLGRVANVDVFCFDDNRGKRVGLRVGVEHLVATMDPHYIVTVDSDTVAHPGAVAAAVHELETNPDVGGTTALVRARNWKTNLLTRLQDLRYANAFLWERAAYSQAGAVLCVCGSFTLWRSEVLRDSVKRLTDQRFLGRECTYGDDRHLTNLALSQGWRITLCETAIADTLVPESVDHFRRQQVRWSKSFFRESLWALRHLPAGWAKTLTVMELATWMIFSIVLLYSLVVRPVLTRDVLLVQILLWVSVMSWVRSVRFFDSRPEASRFDRAFSFLIAPLYGFLHLVVLLPLRAWAMVTLNDTAWGTRAEVEVSGASEATAEDRATRTGAEKRPPRPKPAESFPKRMKREKSKASRKTKV